MTRLGWILLFVGLAVVFGFFGWAFYFLSGSGTWTGGSTPLAIMIAVGVLGVGALAAGLMRLAFYSSRKGYDDAAYRMKRGRRPDVTSG